MNKKFYRAMTLGVGLLLAGNLAVNAQKVTFNGEQVSLKQAFEQIESVSKYKIAYNTAQLDVNRKVTLNQKDTDVLQVLDQLGKLNLPIHISEISLPTYPELPRTLAEEVQGELLRNFYRTWFSQKNCQSIVYWNLCDGTAYGTESRFNAGLICSDFKEKNAYRILDTLVNHEWHTETTVATDENGEAVWNGFYGEYELDFWKFGTCSYQCFDAFLFRESSEI